MSSPLSVEDCKVVNSWKVGTCKVGRDCMHCPCVVCEMVPSIIFSKATLVLGCIVLSSSSRLKF